MLKNKPRRRGRQVLKPGIAIMATGLALAAQAAGIQLPAGTSITTGAGTSIQLGCGDLNVGGTYTQQGDAALGGLGQLGLQQGSVFTAGAGAVALSGTLDVAAGTFNAGSSTVTMGPGASGCGIAQGQIKGSPSFYAWKVIGSVAPDAPRYTVAMPVAQTTTVTALLELSGVNLVSGSAANPSMLAKATPEPARAPVATQAWLKYTGAAPPSISNVGVNGVQSLDTWLAEDQTNKIAGGIAYNWFARALVTDPEPGGVAQPAPVPALDLGGLLALSALVGAAAAVSRRRSRP